jgi:type III pantothenate kinase
VEGRAMWGCILLLAIDVGNTSTVIGVYKDKELKANWRIPTQPQKVDQYGALLKKLFSEANLNLTEVKALAISSVVPPLTPILEEMSRKYFQVEPLIVDSETKTGLTIRYDHPEEVGADRIANAVAAYQIYKGPLIVVDFGTATTFDVISQKGEYLGGVIAPGIEISTKALSEKAAQLPPVELKKPDKVIGKNTVSSMQSGIIYGSIEQVRGIVERIKQELGSPKATVKVIATGGLADLIARETNLFAEVNPFLTLEGLRIIYERNSHQENL